MTIKILTGWSNPGGSTVAHINLTNALNEAGYDTILYGPHDWHLNKCRAEKLNVLQVDEGDSLIIHFLEFPYRPIVVKNYIYSCHETNLTPLKSNLEYIKEFDAVHFVSHSQRKWHGIDVESFVIPNIITGVEKCKTIELGCAGVIGSIDPHKQTHLSIARAFEDGYRDVLVYGNITDQAYYNEKVKFWVDEGVAKLMGHVDNKQEMYESVAEVYHSSLRETFNYIKGECEIAGRKYNGLLTTESGAIYMETKEIIKHWEDVLDL